VKHSDSLGEGSSCDFEIGDIVSWKKLGSKRNIGMVYEIYTVSMGGRQIKKASVASFKDSLHYDVLVLELKLVSKAK
tara:strand:+ start:380 stop:610 length:231 start_codon:yes stop_codon:yes gene_type:complete